MLVLACNPCPCGDYHRARSDQPVPLPRSVRRDYQAQDHRSDRRPDRHHPPRRAADAGRRDPFDTPSPPRTVRARVARIRRPPASAGSADEQLATQRPGAGCRAPGLLAVASERRSASVEEAVYSGRLSSRGRGARAPARLDRRRPAVGAHRQRRHARASTRSTPRCGCGPGNPSCSRSLRTTCRMSRLRRGAARPGRAEPGHRARRPAGHRAGRPGSARSTLRSRLATRRRTVTGCSPTSRPGCAACDPERGARAGRATRHPLRDPRRRRSGREQLDDLPAPSR